MKYYIAYDGEINEDEAFDTFEEAMRERSKQVREACQEDALQGGYSRRREAYYWAITRVVAR